MWLLLSKLQPNLSSQTSNYTLRKTCNFYLLYHSLNWEIQKILNFQGPGCQLSANLVLHIEIHASGDTSWSDSPPPPWFFLGDMKSFEISIMGINWDTKINFVCNAPPPLTVSVPANTLLMLSVAMNNNDMSRWYPHLSCAGSGWWRRVFWSYWPIHWQINARNAERDQWSVQFRIWVQCKSNILQQTNILRSSPQFEKRQW